MADASLLEKLGPGEDVTITFDITQDDIDQGIRSNCIDCPIARSASREFPGYSVAVGSAIHLRTDGRYFMGELPAKASDFVYDFDHGLRVEPFSFTAHFTPFE